MNCIKEGKSVTLVIVVLLSCLAVCVDAVPWTWFSSPPSCASQPIYVVATEEQINEIVRRSTLQVMNLTAERDRRVDEHLTDFSQYKARQEQRDIAEKAENRAKVEQAAAAAHSFQTMTTLGSIGAIGWRAFIYMLVVFGTHARRKYYPELPYPLLQWLSWILSIAVYFMLSPETQPTVVVPDASPDFCANYWRIFYAPCLGVQGIIWLFTKGATWIAGNAGYIISAALAIGGVLLDLWSYFSLCGCCGRPNVVAALQSTTREVKKLREETAVAQTSVQGMITNALNSVRDSMSSAVVTSAPTRMDTSTDAKTTPAIFGPPAQANSSSPSSMFAPHVLMGATPDNHDDDYYRSPKKLVYRTHKSY